MKRPVHQIAFFGLLGSGNIGNDATLETVLAWLASHHPQVAVRCISIAPAGVTARFGIPAVPMTWHSPYHRGSGIAEAFARLLGRVVDIGRSYMLAGSVDAVIVPGMGVLEDSLRVRPWGLPFSLFLMAAACRLRRRPFVFLDVGAEYAANRLTRRLNVATVKRATHVSYRDLASAAAMARAGARAPEAIAPDLAFAHPVSKLTEPEPGRLVVGVMAYYGPADDPVRGAAVRRRYVATMAEALTRLTDRGDRIVLVSGDGVDIDVAHEIRAAVFAQRPMLRASAIVVREFTTFTELTEEMMRAEVVVASRFHNLICALRLARPTVSVGYARKNRLVMEALSLDEYCQEIDQLDADRLFTQIQAARENAQKLTSRIRRGTSEYADEVESLLKRVFEETLGLPVPLGRTVDLPDELNLTGEVDAWHGS